MATKAKAFLFKNYWWIGLILGSVASGLAYHFGEGDWVGLVGASIAGTLGFFYFAQQQRLSETQLFYSLFTDFNSRYDKLNGCLSEIASRAEGLQDGDRAVIVDYFNLCAEEYLFYKQGYIHKDAWRSWCRGMLWYLRRHPFKDVWNEEVQIESFYGLTLSLIKEGADLTS
nr:Orf170 [uncultured bacterium]